MREVTSKLGGQYTCTLGVTKKVEFHFNTNGVRVYHAGTDLRDYDFVWLSSFWDTRDTAFAISNYLDHFGVAHTQVEQNSSKLVDKVLFSLNGLPTPNTFFSDNENIDKLAPSIEKICGFPVIVKDTKGYGGKNSKLIKSRKELVAAAPSFAQGRKFLYQQVIPNEYDWGVLIRDGQAVSAEKSFACKGEFRNNACNGATEVFVDVGEVPEEVVDMAIKASNALGLNWSRPDILIDKNTGKPYLLEVNRIPGMTSGTAEVKSSYDYLLSHLEKL